MLPHTLFPVAFGDGIVRNREKDWEEREEEDEKEEEEEEEKEDKSTE